MGGFIFYLLTSFVLGLSVLGFAAEPEKKDPSAKVTECSDHDRVFKQCRDANKLYGDAEARARKSHKPLLIIYGRDSCPWSRSLMNTLYFSNGAGKISDFFVIQSISSESELGRTMMDGVIAKFGSKVKIDGVPFVAVIDYDKNKAQFFNSELWEKNTEQWKGYDPQKLETFFKSFGLTVKL